MTRDEKICVAAYCRVSTDSGEQALSFASQMRFFREYIAQRPMWTLYEIYADEGVTGTNVKKRDAFKRMIADAREGKFALILTKEISRFARNILDSISYTRELRRMGVGVYFLHDGIDTRDADAELRLAILSSIAQEESRRTSERVKWGQKRRMEAGVVFGHSLLGYDVKEGRLEINEAGALIVRRIFDLFCEEHKGYSAIARRLAEEGLFPTQAKSWSPSVIARILKNEKYCGDLIQKKTVTTDYLSHEKKYNRGEEPLVILRDHHEPIIARSLFERAQMLMAGEKKGAIREKFSDRYAFSAKIRCGICGKYLTARVQKRKNGIYHLWRCEGHVHARNEMLCEMAGLCLAAREDALRSAREAVMQRLSALFFTAYSADAGKRLLELYLLGEIGREEYLLQKARLSTKEERLLSLERQLDSAWTEEAFLREAIDLVTLHEDRAEVRLGSTAASFWVDIKREGRRYQLFLSDIQNQKGNDSLLFGGEN